MMAAADLSRSRGVDRSTRGLFFISTLLCLICFANSLNNKDQLDTSKENLLKLKQQLDKLRAAHKTEMAMFSEMLTEYTAVMDPMTDFVKKYVPDVFPPVGTFLDNTKAYLEKTKVRLERQNEELERKMEETEENLVTLKKKIDFLAEQQAEL